MTVVDARAPASPPTPEECEHPAPVRGVMAHEFATYQGAMGPEGKRRTVTHYGPVLGGLPIEAWHCELCGLLRLTFPDGRVEERRLFPGPQPGLLAVPSAYDPDAVGYGMQARVSGLSAPAELMAALLPPPAPAGPNVIERVAAALPPLGAVTWATVILLAATCIGLLLAGYLAVYDYQTSSVEGPLVIAVGCCFAAAVGVQILSVVQRHYFPMPPLRPSVAVTMRERPRLDPATRIMVALMGLVATGLLLAGILAVYTYSTPAAEHPLVIGIIVCFGAAMVVKIVDATTRHFLR
ncbi:MAG: hypothetical protein E6J14_08490 [Chloroflexi bacterium]|nr:MAG: hypothetical protein E6J14_08490 [Chloroflexota bacterium]